MPAPPRLPGLAAGTVTDELQPSVLLRMLVAEIFRALARVFVRLAERLFRAERMRHPTHYSRARSQLPKEAAH